MENYKTHKGETKAWEENKGKCYYLVRQHCPLELNTELKNSAHWETTASDTNVVALLLIIRAVMHNKEERAQSKMGLVESDAALYTTIMKGNQTLEEYLWLFEAQIDTILAHGGNPGYQLGLTEEHL